MSAKTAAGFLTFRFPFSCLFNTFVLKKKLLRSHTFKIEMILYTLYEMILYTSL